MEEGSDKFFCDAKLNLSKFPTQFAFFKVENLFCVGSPLAVFLTLRGLRPQDDVEDHVLPKSVCKRVLNIYHPADPVVRNYII